MSSVHVPHFDQKFQYLFSRHPAIKTYKALAKAVGVSEALISGWKNGTDTTHRECIPIRHIGKVCETLGVAHDVLVVAELDAFRHLLGAWSAPGLWDRLAAAAAPSGRLTILPAHVVRHQPGLLLATRRLIAPDDLDDDVPAFSPGEEVLVRLDAEPGQHAVLLEHDQAGWHCLHPSRRQPLTRLDGPLFFPAQRDPDQPVFARVGGTVGPLVLLAVLSMAALPETLLRDLAEAKDPEPALQTLAVALGGEALHPGVTLLQTRCHVRRAIG